MSTQNLFFLFCDRGSLFDVFNKHNKIQYHQKLSLPKNLILGSIFKRIQNHQKLSLPKNLILGSIFKRNIFCALSFSFLSSADLRSVVAGAFYN